MPDRGPHGSPPLAAPLCPFPLLSQPHCRTVCVTTLPSPADVWGVKRFVDLKSTIQCYLLTSCEVKGSARKYTNLRGSPARAWATLTLRWASLGSLRVNLDMGKAAYRWMIMRDDSIPGTVVRTSTIPEELGRLVYLLTDKTGTARARVSRGLWERGTAGPCLGLLRLCPRKPAGRTVN